MGFPRYDLETLRVTGVLQRIAICYLFAAILFLNTGWRIHLATAVAILFGYFVLLISIPPPGCHSGSLSKECNLASYVDRSILGKRAGAGTHDPEGLLSTLPAAATTLLGMLAGQWLRTQASDCQKIIWLALAGLCGIALGWIWHRWFPVNKSLWTSSYVLATAGVSSIFLALCYAMRTPAQWWRPIQVLGASALAAFVASEVGSRLLALEAWHGLPQRGGHSLQNHLYEWLLSSGSEPKLASLVYALGYLGVVLLLATIVGRSVCARRL